MVVELLAPYRATNGGLHNPGERAAFSEEIAAELMRRGIARAVPRTTSVDHPPMQTMVPSPARKKTMAR